MTESHPFRENPGMAMGIVIPPELEVDERFRRLMTGFCDAMEHPDQSEDIRRFFRWSFDEEGRLMARQLQKDVGAFNALYLHFGRWLADFFKEKLHLADSPTYEDFSKTADIPQALIDETRRKIGGRQKFLDGFGVVDIPENCHFTRKILNLIPIPYTTNPSKQASLDKEIRESARHEQEMRHIDHETARIWQWLIEHWQDPSVAEACDRYLRFLERLSHFEALLGSRRTLMHRRAVQTCRQAVNAWNQGREEEANGILDTL